MPNNRNRFLNLLPYLIVTAFIILMMFQNPFSADVHHLGYNEFVTAVEEDRVEKAAVSVDYNTIAVSGVYKDSKEGNEGIKRFIDRVNGV